MFDFFRKNPSRELVDLLELIGGGIQKRVDENRELMEFLLDRAPLLMENSSWVVGWIKSNDDVFVALEAMARNFEIKPRFSDIAEDSRERAIRRIPSNVPRFPRPWPATREILAKSKIKEWQTQSYPLQCITIELQGTRHSDLKHMMAQLTEVVARIECGDSKGESSDDDFGYRFTVSSREESIFHEPAT